jgi:hypothetical protein
VRCGRSIGRGKESGGSIGRRFLDDDIGPVLASPIVSRRSGLHIALPSGRVGLAHGALGMNARQRINGVLADRAALPAGIDERRIAVVVPGIHQDLSLRSMRMPG